MIRQLEPRSHGLHNFLVRQQYPYGSSSYLFEVNYHEVVGSLETLKRQP